MTNKIRIKAGISRTARRNQSKPTVVNIDSRPIRKAESEEYLKSQNVRAFLSAIAWAEGGDYHAKAGAWKDPKKWHFTNESTHPGAGLSGSTAAGRYQITIATWRDHGVKGMGISDFSPHTQDLIAVSILKRAGAVQPLLVNDFKNAMEKASGPWAALEKALNKETGTLPSHLKNTKTFGKNTLNLAVETGGSSCAKKYCIDHIFHNRDRLQRFPSRTILQRISKGIN